MVSRLQAKAGQIGKILNNLEKYNHLIKDAARENKREFCAIRPTSFDKKLLPFTKNESKTIASNSAKTPEISVESRDNSVDEVGENKEHNITISGSGSFEIVDGVTMSAATTAESIVKLETEESNQN